MNKNGGTRSAAKRQRAATYSISICSKGNIVGGDWHAQRYVACRSAKDRIIERRVLPGLKARAVEPVWRTCVPGSAAAGARSGVIGIPREILLGVKRRH